MSRKKDTNVGTVNNKTRIVVNNSHFGSHDVNVLWPTINDVNMSWQCFGAPCTKFIIGFLIGLIGSFVRIGGALLLLDIACVLWLFVTCSGCCANHDIASRIGFQQTSHIGLGSILRCLRVISCGCRRILNIACETKYCGAHEIDWFWYGNSTNSLSVRSKVYRFLFRIHNVRFEWSWLRCRFAHAILLSGVRFNGGRWLHWILPENVAWTTGSWAAVIVGRRIAPNHRPLERCHFLFFLSGMCFQLCLF